MKKIKDLCVAVQRYTDDNQQKLKYKKIGVEITEEKNGKETTYILLDKYINLAGFPNFSDKMNTTNVLVAKFDQAQTNDENRDEKVYEKNEGAF